MGIEPDTKDWTWVVQRRCPECGLDAAAVPAEQIAEEIRSNAAEWTRVRGQTEPEWWSRRPDPGTWSPLEYAAHVRDVHRVFTTRLEALLTEHDPLWPDWDQDAAAVEGEYASEDVDAVLEDLSAAADHIAAQYRGLTAQQWQRPARRSDGASFTGATMARYHLHDVVHHLGDITRHRH